MRYEEHALNEETYRQYHSCWEEFRAYCAERGYCELPAAAASIACYLTSCAKRGLKYDALKKRLAAIRRAHQMARQGDPTRDRNVRRFLLGVRRSCGYPRLKHPLTEAEIERVIASRDVTSTNTVKRLRAKRDKAMLLLFFTGPLRRKEADVCYQDVLFATGGMLFRNILRRHKPLTIARRGGDKCAVTATEDWCAEAHIVRGPIFRAVKSNGTLSNSALTPWHISRRIRQIFAEAGLEDRYGIASFFKGHVSEASRRAVPPIQIQRQTGLSPRRVRRYKSPWAPPGHRRIKSTPRRRRGS